MSCSHCSQEASLQTECCSRVYCGEECLKADLIQHDLECVDLKLPQWMRRRAPEQIRIVPGRGGVHTKVYFYADKKTRDSAFDRYQRSQRLNDLNSGSVLVRDIEAGKKYLRYTENRPGYFIVY